MAFPQEEEEETIVVVVMVVEDHHLKNLPLEGEDLTDLTLKSGSKWTE